MAMPNFQIKGLFFVLLLNSYFAYSEEVDIENMQSTQGISLTCPVSLEESLRLDIYGEIGKRQISLDLDNKNYIINDKDISYTKSIYDGGGIEPHYPLVITRTIYFSAGKPLSGLAINEDDIDKSEESLEIMKEALIEAHEKGKCLN